METEENLQNINSNTRKRNIKVQNASGENFVPTWNDENTDLLIKCRLENDDLFKGRASGEGWTVVLKKMKKSVNMDEFLEVHLSKKWANLCRIYKDCNKFLMHANNLNTSYFYIFDDYYKNKSSAKTKFKKSSNTLEDYCRLCQKMRGEYYLFEDQNLCMDIENVTSINVAKDPKSFPKHICPICKSTLDQIKNFLSRCLSVDKNLRETEVKIDAKTDTENVKIQSAVNNDIPVNNDKYTCQICTVRFKKESNLIDHLKRKHQIEKLTSDLENNDVENEENEFEEIYLEYESANEETFVNLEENLEIEVNCENKDTDIEKINKAQVYTCLICSKQFSSRSEFRKHEKHHVGIKHKCPRKNCNKTYSTLSSIKAHELRDHQGVKPYLCTLCGKGFINPQTLKAHEKMHLGQKDISCAFCQKKFYTKSNLYTHTRVYHLGYVHFCSQCPRSFASKSSLDRHEAMHTGIKEFKCENCGSEFYTKRELEWHINRVHKEEKNFNCNICFKSFHTKYTLNVHSLIHTGQKPFPCEFHGCEKRFRTKRKMKDHLKVHYKNNDSNT